MIGALSYGDAFLQPAVRALKVLGLPATSLLGEGLLDPYLVPPIVCGQRNDGDRHVYHPLPEDAGGGVACHGVDRCALPRVLLLVGLPFPVRVVVLSEDIGRPRAAALAGDELLGLLVGIGQVDQPTRNDLCVVGVMAMLPGDSPPGGDGLPQLLLGRRRIHDKGHPPFGVVLDALGIDGGIKEGRARFLDGRGV